MPTILQSIAEYYSAISFRISHASLPVLLVQCELYCSFAYKVLVCTYALIFLFNFETAYRNSANDIPMESSSKSATFSYRNFSQILIDLNLILKLLHCTNNGRKRIFAIILKRFIRLVQMMIRWKDIEISQNFHIESFFKFFTVFD